jgi:hypothetical protein
MTPLLPHNPISPFSLDSKGAKGNIDIFALPETLVPGKKPTEDVGSILIEVSAKDEKSVEFLKRCPLNPPLHESLLKLALTFTLQVLIESIKKAPPPRKSLG